MTTSIFINEIHYDNVGTDVGESIEIAGPAGSDLAGWTLVFYNGSNPQNATSYSTVALSGIIDNESNGFGAISFALPAGGSAIQNGANDGVALVRPDGTVAQLLSYEGIFTAGNGPAAGLVSTDIGVSESGTTPVGFSLQLSGSGTTYEDFTWQTERAASAGSINAGQSFGAPPVIQAGVLSIANASLIEGNSGTVDLVFTVTRADGSEGAVSATWTISLNGTADAADLAAGQVLTGSVSFAAGATSAEVRVAIAGDTAFEPDENFTVTLSDPTGGATISGATATGTILNDDAAPPAEAPNVFINEIHYDNAGTDTGEAIEIAGVAGTDLSGYRLVLYNGTNTPNAAPAYATINLSGVIDDEGQGYGAVVFAAPGLQNGGADGVALIAPNGAVIQLLSYEGTFTAAAGTPAAGVTSTDIGVSENGSGPVGSSLALAGSGAASADFTFQPEAPNSFGSLNPGQVIIPDNGTGLISVADARVVEGDNGISNLVFTVRRAGGLAQSASVDFAVSLSDTASADDLGAGAVLSGTLNFAVGARTATVTIPVQGDLVGEKNETLSLVLSNPVGNIAIADGSALGTIVNDDPIALSISQIQGAGHRSEFVGQTVVTTGIVTAVDTNGFYIQDPAGDGDARTSDAVFVFSGTAPLVRVGDAISVNGTVSEFKGSAKSLSVTQLTNPVVTVNSSGNALPESILIGVNGILPPSTVIDDDSFTVFDPQNDGIDFWEALEGMRVTIETPQVVSNTNGFGETDVVASLGAGATGINDRGGITISEGDFNPEKIQIDDDSGIFAGFAPSFSIGDQLSSVTGIVNYSFENFEVIVTEAVTTTLDVTLSQEVTTLAGDTNNLSIATYNVENLDLSDMKFDILARNIVVNLRAPDIIALQEIQDQDGAGNGANLSGVVTAQGLIDAIALQSGLRYAYVEIAPSVANSTGGEPGGNIRNGYLYNIDRVSYVDGSAALITGSVYNNSRSPLVAQFSFAGQTITTINVHSTSRGGSDPLFGETQPPVDAGDAQRTAQAAGVKAYVDNQLATNPNLQFVILGDFNGFYFENAQRQLTDPALGGVFTNLNSLLAPEERYSFVFNGNAQALDHILVTGGLLPNAKFDAVHINAQFSGARATDHDPQLALLQLGAAPKDIGISNASVAENMPAGSVVGTVSATDTANDTITYSLVDNAAGLFAIDPATGAVTTTAALNFEEAESYSIIARATDAGGLFIDKEITVFVTDVNEAPVAVADTATTTENTGVIIDVLANDIDVDVNDDKTIVSATAPKGSVAIVDGNLAFDPGTAFDALAAGATEIVTIAYSISDAAGLTASSTVMLTVTGVNDAPVAVDDTASVTEDQSVSGNVIAGGDSDIDLGDVLSVTQVNGQAAGVGALVSGAYGTLLLSADGTYSYAADADVLDTLAFGTAPLVDSFTYQISDGNGGTATATLSFNVAIANDVDSQLGTNSRDVLSGDRMQPGVEDTIRGGNANDVIDGKAGADRLYGDNGNDVLLGGSGRDVLDGGNGNDRLEGGLGDDTLFGGRGDDLLIGGAGADTFVFLPGNVAATGNDVISDFELGIDRLSLQGGVTVARMFQQNGDTVVQFSSGGSVTIQNLVEADWAALSASIDLSNQVLFA